jgi:hypothetical protein
MNTQPFSPDPSGPNRAASVRAGTGVRATVSMLGNAYTGPSNGASYPHPWKAALGGLTVRLATGLIEGREAKIGKKRLSEGAVLPLDPTKISEAGESWICVEFAPNADGLVDAKTDIQLRQTKEVRSLDEKLARCAIAMVLWQGKQVAFLQQIVHFNLRYKRVKPPAGQGVVEHVFY